MNCSWIRFSLPVRISRTMRKIHSKRIVEKSAAVQSEPEKISEYVYGGREAADFKQRMRSLYTSFCNGSKILAVRGHTRRSKGQRDHLFPGRISKAEPSGYIPISVLFVGKNAGNRLSVSKWSKYFGSIPAVVQRTTGILQDSEKEEMSCYGSSTMTAHFLQYGFFWIAYLCSRIWCE